jgi:hypothetical protein
MALFILPPLLRSPLILPLAAWVLTLLVLLARASLPGRRSQALRPLAVLVFATVLLMSLAWTSCGGGNGGADSPTAARRSPTDVSPPSQLGDLNQASAKRGTRGATRRPRVILFVQALVGNQSLRTAYPVCAQQAAMETLSWHAACDQRSFCHTASSVTFEVRGLT